MAHYNLKSSMSDRANLDQAAWANGWGDYTEHYVQLEGEKAIREHATELAKDYIGVYNVDSTDDEEEYIARFVDSYTKGYQAKAQSKAEEQEA